MRVSFGRYDAGILLLVVFGFVVGSESVWAVTAMYLTTKVAETYTKHKNHRLEEAQRTMRERAERRAYAAGREWNRPLISKQEHVSSVPPQAEIEDAKYVDLD